MTTFITVSSKIFKRLIKFRLDWDMPIKCWAGRHYEECEQLRSTMPNNLGRWKALEGQFVPVPEPRRGRKSQEVSQHFDSKILAFIVLNTSWPNIKYFDRNKQILSHTDAGASMIFQLNSQPLSLPTEKVGNFSSDKASKFPKIRRS